MTETKRPWILIVEDDADQRLLYAEYLRHEDFDVEAVPSADAALERMSKKVPSALMLDMGMAGASGLAVINAVRSDERTSSVPIIVVTGVSKQDDIWQGREWGWDHYVEKPPDMPNLVTLLREVTTERPRS